jgi:hypothetical protein
MLPLESEESLWKPELYIYDLKRFALKHSISSQGIHSLMVKSVPVTTKTTIGDEFTSSNNVTLTLSDRFEVSILMACSSK